MIDQKQFKDLNLKLDDLFYKRCEQFISLLQQWGAVHNITAQLTNKQIEANIIDSIYPMKFLNSFETLADIGTGAGYPGILLAIVNPQKTISLIEPKAKRVAFLNFVKATLDLKNVNVVQNRVENLLPKKFDIITSRAVTNISLLLSLTQNLSDNHTEYLLYKGTLCNKEIDDAKLNNYKIISNGKYRNYLYIKRKGLFDDI